MAVVTTVVYGVAQAVRVERAGDGDVELHRVQVAEIPCGTAWKSSPCCSGVRGRMSAIRYCVLQLVDLVLAEPGGGDIGGGQTSPALGGHGRRCRPGRRTKVG